MAYLQSTKTPSISTRSITLTDFSGGINNRANALNVNEASDMLNMRFVNDTLLEKRPGCKVWSNFSWIIDDSGVSVPIDTVVGLDIHKPYSGEDNAVILTETKVWYKAGQIDNQSKETWKSIANNGTTKGTNHMGFYVFCSANGIHLVGKAPLKSSTYEKVYNIDAVQDVELDGNLTKENHFFTLVKTPASGDTNYNAPLDTSHVRGVMCYNYSNKTCWYVPCQNELNDPYLGENVLPTKARYVESHKGRLYVAGMEKDDDSIYLSQTSNPFYFPVGLGLQLTPNSDKITGLHTFDDGVVVTRNEDVHVIKGETNNPELELELFTVNKLNTHTGCPSSRTIVPVYEHLFFLGTDGNLYALSSVDTDDKTLATTQVNTKFDFTKAPFSCNCDTYEGAFATFHRDEYYLCMGKKVYVFNYRIKAWTVYEGLDATAFGIYDDTLVWAGKTDNAILTWDEENFTDNGRPYYAYWQSGRMDLGDPIAYKSFKEFFILNEVNKNPSDILVQFEIDSIALNGEYIVNNSLGQWKVAEFADKFIGEGLVCSDPMVIGERGRFLRIRLVSGNNAPVTVVSPEELPYISGKFPFMLAYATETRQHFSYQPNGKENTWKLLGQDLNFKGPMKIYQVSCVYDMKGRR